MDTSTSKRHEIKEEHACSCNGLFIETKKEVQKSDYSEHHSHFTIPFDNRKNKKPKIASLSSFFPIKKQSRSGEQKQRKKKLHLLYNWFRQYENKN
jgi:hypothetical protein